MPRSVSGNLERARIWPRTAARTINRFRGLALRGLQVFFHLVRLQALAESVAKASAPAGTGASKPIVVTSYGMASDPMNLFSYLQPAIISIEPAMGAKSDVARIWR